MRQVYYKYCPICKEKYWEEGCPSCRRKKEDAELEKYLAELKTDRNLEEMVIELAKRVYRLENRPPRYAPPPVYG